MLKDGFLRGNFSEGGQGLGSEFVPEPLCILPVKVKLHSGLEDSDRGCFCVSLVSLMEQGLWVGGLKSGFSLGWCNFLIWEMTFVCLLE